MINFAIMGEMKLLETMLGGRGAWVSAVQAECEDSARTGYYPGIEDAFDFMPEPSMLDAFETREARLVQQYIAEPTDPPTKSLGEAQTIVMITNRRIKAVFITDDGGARCYIKDQDLPIEVYSTTDLLALAVRANLLSEDSAVAHIATLTSRNRKRISLKRFNAVLSKNSRDQNKAKAS